MGWKARLWFGVRSAVIHIYEVVRQGMYVCKEKLARSSLKEIYSRMERELLDIDIGKNGNHVLESAGELLGSVCMDPE